LTVSRDRIPHAYREFCASGMGEEFFGTKGPASTFVEISALAHQDLDD